MAGLSLTHFSASWPFVTVLRPAPFCHRRRAIGGLHVRYLKTLVLQTRIHSTLTAHFSLDMKINQSYSLLTKIQTFE